MRSHLCFLETIFFSSRSVGRVENWYKGNYYYGKADKRSDCGTIKREMRFDNYLGGQSTRSD